MQYIYIYIIGRNDQQDSNPYILYIEIDKNRNFK